MKFLQVCAVSLVLGCSLIEIQALPAASEQIQHQVVILLPQYIQADLPASANNPQESIVAPIPLTLLDIESDNKSSVNSTEESQRSTRSLGFGGLGNFGGLGGKFGNLGLGLKGFGGLGGLGLGGLNGLSLGGFKPFFGKFFG